VYALITCNASYPNNDIIGAIGGCDPWGASAALTHAPGAHDRGRICRGNPVGPDRAGIVMKGKICALAGVVCDSRRPSISARDVSLSHS
jgi:hypothetical protein